MSDTKKMARIYLSDIGILINAIPAGIGLAAAVANWAWYVPLLLVGGWASYVAQEYLVHRYIFHMNTPRNQFAFNLLYRLHYGHHDQVFHRKLLFTPVWFSVPLGLLNVAAVSLVLPIEQALIFTYGGGVTAYMVFEWLHLLSHFNLRHPGGYATRLARRHGRHHFIDYDNWFTVSPGGGLMDKALRTDPTERQFREHVRTCGIDPHDERLTRAREKFGSDTTLDNRGGFNRPATAG